MLSEGSLPLIDIAARVGFQTQQHFTAPRAFRLAHHRLRSRDALSAGSVSDQQTQEFDTFGQGLERRARLAGVGLTGIGAAPSFPTSKIHRCTHGRIRVRRPRTPLRILENAMKTNLASAARLSTFILALSAGGFVASGATAQDAPIAGKATLGVTVTEAQLVARGWRASKIIHTDVYNEKNEKIGRVDDLIVAPDGSLSAAIIDVGGFLGMAAHRVAIPIQQFKQIAPKAIVVGANKDALKKLPEFEYAKG
ncbi:PRC-barrel domain-containing protein [Paraburkholderia strydomiana]|uniref:PRC-barrel domain-containing protein n=2 Tax=Burkholderiaceae TaxID=119060 RepID=UPI0038BD470A